MIEFLGPEDFTCRFGLGGSWWRIGLFPKEYLHGWYHDSHKSDDGTTVRIRNYGRLLRIVWWR